MIHSKKLFLGLIVCSAAFTLSAMDKDTAKDVAKVLALEGSRIAAPYAAGTSLLTLLPVLMGTCPGRQKLAYATVHMIAGTGIGTMGGAYVGYKSQNRATVQKYAPWAGIIGGIVVAPYTYLRRYSNSVYDKYFN